MRIINGMLLFAILTMLTVIVASMEKWGNELVMTKVTKVEHHYHYDIEHYGLIELNDKIEGLGINY